MQMPPFQDRPPESESVTAYDELHFVTYLRLLDAYSRDIDWRKVVRKVFGIDPERCSRARQIYDSHLARARWITERGYRELLSRSDD